MSDRWPSKQDFPSALGDVPARVSNGTLVTSQYESATREELVEMVIGLRDEVHNLQLDWNGAQQRLVNLERERDDARRKALALDQLSRQRHTVKDEEAILLRMWSCIRNALAKEQAGE